MAKASKEASELVDAEDGELNGEAGVVPNEARKLRDG
jgi:hypothetical protein